MGVRLSGGIGPLRVSVPVLGGSGANAAVGLFGLMMKGLVYLVWFELVLCWYLLLGCYWLLRGVYWEGPRAAWRWWQRRQATR